MTPTTTDPDDDEAAGERPQPDLPSEPTALVLEVRPPLRQVAPRWFATLGIVGLIGGVLYLLGTDAGRQIIEARGLLACVGGWLLLLAMTLGAGFAALALSRAVSSGQRPLRQRQVVRHVIGESLAAGVGCVVGAFLGALAWGDVMRLLAFALAFGAIFTWAVLMPASLARFEEHAA